MKITEARMEIDGGNEAVYVDVEADLPRLPDGPYLAIGVEDFAEAQEMIATIDRSRAHKKRTTKNTPAPGAEPAGPPKDGDGARAEVPRPADLPARCETPDCANEGVVPSEGGHFCDMHSGAGASVHREWHAAFRKAQAKKARGFRERIENGAT